MENDENHDDEFIINLTIDGTSFEEVEVKVNDPSKTIRDQINKIVQVFELPKLDFGGRPILYLIGKVDKDNFSDETDILEFEDENGREQSLLDYRIKPGDCLRLITVPLAYGCPIPEEMQKRKQESFFSKLKHYFKKH